MPTSAKEKLVRALNLFSATGYEVRPVPCAGGSDLWGTRVVHRGAQDYDLYLNILGEIPVQAG